MSNKYGFSLKGFAMAAMVATSMLSITACGTNPGVNNTVEAKVSVNDNTEI